MNRHVRPLQLPRARYSARLHWPDLFGGGTEVLGPFDNHSERDRAVAAKRAPYPASYWPSVMRVREEEPSPGAWDVADPDLCPGPDDGLEVPYLSRQEGTQ